MFSQGGEEEVILTMEGEGRYLDIGAYDGKTFSNVRALAERGWEGVCVEPAPHAFAAMVLDPPPNATLVHALIGERTELSPFLCTQDAVSTTDPRHAEKWSRFAEFRPIYTVSVSLLDLLTQFPGPYRFVSIDTEGTSKQIFDQLDLDQLETEMIAVEHDGYVIQRDGFQEVYRDPNNVILRRA